MDFTRWTTAQFSFEVRRSCKTPIGLAHKVTWYPRVLLNIKHSSTYCTSTTVVILTARCPIAMATQSSFISQETTSSLPPEPMPSPSIDGTKYASKFALLEGLNNYTKQYGYSVVIRSTSKNNKGIKSKAYIICNRGRKPEPNHKRKATEKRAATSKRIDCPF